MRRVRWRLRQRMASLVLLPSARLRAMSAWGDGASETQAYIAPQTHRRQEHHEAVPLLKRHLTRRIWHLLQTPRPNRTQTLRPRQLLDIGE